MGVKNRKRKLKKGQWLSILIFLVGLLVFLYPRFSDWYYRQEAEEERKAFDQGAAKITPAELERAVQLASAYNRTLDPGRLSDPFTREEKEGVAAYARMLEIHQMIGHVDIPKINVALPVFAGTADEVLEKGGGHLEGTSLPIGGNSTHAVITAHRGLPRAELFRRLDELELGDVFYFTNIAGTMAYQVDQVLTVEPSNFTPVLVQKGEDLMTLLTCTPYMVNSHRLLVRGHRIPYTEAVAEDSLEEGQMKNHYRQLLWISLAVIVLLLLLLIRSQRKLRSVQRRYARRQEAQAEEKISRN